MPNCPHSVEVPGYGRRNLTMVLLDSGVSSDDIDGMSCRDVHDMVAVIARSNFIARTDRRLLLNEYPPSPASPRPDRRVLVARILDALAALMLAVVAITVWRFLA